MKCVVCRGTLQRLGVREGATYTTCSLCQTVQLYPIPPEEELDRLYRDVYSAEGHYHRNAETHGAARRRVCEQVARIVTSLHADDDPRIIVDLGSGWGTLVSVLTERGLPIVGYELSESMCDYATESGLAVRNGGLEALETDTALRGSLRTIVTMAVFEHLPDQTGTLRRLAELLPHDGAIVIQAPTAGIPRVLGRALGGFGELPSFFGSLAPPWHVCLPTPKSIRYQADQCGLKVTSIQPSLSGRDKGWRRVLQALNESVARLGHHSFGENWPLAMGHVFVLRPLP